MKQKFIVKKSQDFEKIIFNKQRTANRVFTVYKKKNKYEYSRFGISVGKKHGNAVTRNKLKRQIRSIVDKYSNIMESGFDYVIVLKPQESMPIYSQLENSFNHVLKVGKLKVKEHK